MSDLIKTNVPGLYKDKRTNAFINTNEYVKPIKNDVRNADKDIKLVKNEIGSIKNELKELKSLLLQMVGKN